LIKTGPSPRALLLDELSAYRSFHPEEAALVDRFAAFVRSRKDAFHRSCLEGHVTGSAFIMDPGLERLLFVHHVKLDRWLQPGGHCEAGESARAAASREAYEETAVLAWAYPGLGLFDVDIHPIPARGEVPAHLHYDARYLFLACPVGERPSEESHAVAWLDFAEALRRNPELSIRRPVAKILALGANKTKPAG
jgi:8-oxo-dGTP pyrophosphatase MutT (NUDIX family)